MTHPTWPLYDLRLRTPDLELRLPTDDELVALCQVARAGVHDPEFMPFGVPWTDKRSPQFEREFMQHHWQCRAAWTAQKWNLALGVFVHGAPAGCQHLSATDFPVLREVQTGSWLGAAFQGQGYGKQMRAAVLHLSFAGLDAVAAHSGAFTDNRASLAVSRALGYQDNGTYRMARRGAPAEHLYLLLTSQRWQQHQYCDVTVEGLDACRDMFGC